MNKAMQEEVKKVKEEGVKVPSFEEILALDLVNESKALRAYKAVFGQAKPGSAELTLKAKLMSDFKGNDLVVEVYRGLGGLVNSAKAKKNRESEAKDKKKRAAR